MLEQVVNRHRQIVVRVHQPGRRDDTVTVVIRVIREGQVKFVAQRQQARHRALGGAVHADCAVFIEVHKAEGLIDVVVNDGQVEIVMLSDTLPVFDTGAAQRIDAQRQSGFLDRRHIDDIRQPFNKRLHQILFFNVAGGQRRIKRNTLDALQTGSEQFIGAIFDNLGHVGIRRAAVWRIVLDTTVFRRVVGRRDHNTVSQRTALFVMHQNRIGNRRRRGEAVFFLNDDVDAVCRQHFQYGNESRFGECVRVLPDIAWAGDPVLRAVFRNCLSNRQNVLLVEVVARRAAAVTGGAKLHRMFRVADFRLQHIVLGSQLGYVNQITLLRRLTRALIDCHCLILLVQKLIN